MATSPLPTPSHTGHNTIFFQPPPKSPASVSTTPSLATATDDFSTHNRKRQRPESRDGFQSQHLTETPDWAESFRKTPRDKLYGSAYGRSSGSVNERYRLADGFDTPSLQSTARFEHLTGPEHELRRRLRGDDMGFAVSGDSAPMSGPLARERNGVARIPAGYAGEAQKTWTSLAFGIVGSVFSFGTSVFRGFTAGGGRGYERAFPLVGSDLLQQSAGRSTPIPGSWHADDFDGDFDQDSPYFGQQQPQSRPPNKRRQTDRDTWVMIGTPDVTDRPGSPRRKVSGGNDPRTSLTARPQASRAHSRRSLAPVPKRQNSYVAANGSPAQQPLSMTKMADNNRRASVAPTRSPQGRTGSRPNSAGSGKNYFVSPEVERYTKRQAKQDKAINSMSKRMEDMIRQAQQALGTKYTVEGDGLDMEDEGFVDDEW